MRTLRFLLLLLSYQAINAADMSRRIPQLLRVVKEQNETISRYDGVMKRYVRHARLCCNDPKAFCSVEDEQGIEKLLLNHVMKQDLMLNGQSISIYGGPFAQKMTEAFKEDQKKEIHEYVEHKSADAAELDCACCCSTAAFFLPVVMHQVLDFSPHATFLTFSICHMCAKFSIASATK